MATRSVATVFGGSGFIGRYIVKRLAHKGFVVRVAVRDPERALFLKPMGAVGQVVPLYASLTNEPTVHRAVDGADLVVNTVGILAEQRAGRLPAHPRRGGRAGRAPRRGRRRRAPGAHLGDRRRSRRRQPLRRDQGHRRGLAARGVPRRRRSCVRRWCSAPRTQLFNRFAGMARLMPFMPVICGDTRFQPVYVGDVADAVMAALARPDAAGAVYELGGPRVWQFRELLAYILKETGRKRRMVDVPMGLARLQARIMELVPGKPLTRDQLLMLQQDNVVAADMPGLHGAGHRADAGGTGGADLSAAVPAGRRHAQGAAAGADRRHRRTCRSSRRTDRVVALGATRGGGAISDGDAHAVSSPALAILPQGATCAGGEAAAVRSAARKRCGSGGPITWN